jgi:integrase
MGRRRQFGAIRQLPSGRFQARLPDGTAAPITFTSKADANRWLSAAETDLIRGTYDDRQPSTTLTVGEWLDEWHREHSLHKRPGTLARDRSAIRTHIEPALGNVGLAKLRPQDVQQFVAKLTDKVGPGTTHSVYAVLRSALRDATDLELIPKAPTKGVKLPSIPATGVVVLRPEELYRLARKLPEPWRPMPYVAAVCGLRSAEIIGLRVGRLDLIRRQLHVVDTSPQVGPDRAEPKSSAGRRTVPMPAFLAEMLAAHLAARGLDTSSPDELVFTAKRGGRLWAGNFHVEVWGPAREAAGLPTLRFHDLRHSAVPLWVEMGANLLQVSRWLGHSSVKVTADVYGHLFAETNDAVMAKVDAAYRESDKAAGAT